ncbi:PAAR-like protein [Flavobacterium lipolyticum]|uniref:DUF4280 domain-containing protein n=1 Tax=Flavobacterium lipolyticum TaxID=2893754 RepID=A0ABS8LV82_9FLAO|nr:PAAR-like protein [Flavobacterium sp. F-126]MCC9016456.1 DUF4280 domain-containing protein [Flavobacterium sp. F-126]
MAKYICNGAQCKCTLGTEDGTLEVKSQTKIFIQDKLMATENEKTFVFPNFTSCKIQNPPIPCQPAIEAPWSSTKNNVLQSEHKGLLEASTAFCTFGQGEISIIDSKQTQTKNVIFGDYSSEPKEISKVYAKVRTLETYNGEFGFDWVDVDPETMEIQKIQGVPFEKVEYFYKKGNTAQDLGNIIPIGEDKPGAIKAIQKNYGLINFDNHFEMPFVLLKPGEPVTLSLEVFFEGESQDDYISITGDEYYSFKIDGEEERKDENDKTTKKKIVANEQLQLTIKCSKESLDKKYFFLHTGAKGPREIGGLNMMKNKVLKLKFRVIALVSNEGNPNEKAKALFKKFKNAGIKEYLNNNSLNQAGYAVEIENFEAMDASKVDDYFYAFDKEDWTRKKYFASIIKQKPDVDPVTGNCRIESWDPIKKECNKKPVITEVIVDDQKDLGLPDKANEMDEITISEYKKKLRNKGKPFNEGGIIILSDFESSDEKTGAYSRTSPLNHYALIVYSTNTNNKDTYSHEIGHMLGLPHLFYDSKEKEEYKVARENILGNGLPVNNPDGTKNEKFIPPIETKILKLQSETNKIYSLTTIIGKKSTLIEKITKTNIYFQYKTSYYTRLKTNVEREYKGQPGSTIVAGTGKNTQTKDQYLSVCKNEIDKNTSYLQENTSTLQILNSIHTDKIQLHKYKINLKASDYSLVLIETKKYYYSVIDQIHSNYLLFKQGSTKNIMDYHNSRLVYFHNQIKIMRDDIENY